MLLLTRSRTLQERRLYMFWFRKRKLRRAAQKILDVLDSYDQFINSQDKVNLILVLAGAKKAALLDVQWIIDDVEDHQRANECVGVLVELLRSIGLRYSSQVGSGDFYDMGITFGCYDFLVGRTPESVAGIKNLSTLNGAAYHRFLGNAVDIPVTAIDGWLQDDYLEEDELPIEVTESDYYKFLLFRLSRNHWQQELEVVKFRARTIRVIAPNLYESIVKAAH